MEQADAHGRARNQARNRSKVNQINTKHAVKHAATETRWAEK